MPPGPLPKPDKRRRNAPTIPTTELPASGRKGRPPKIPEGYELGKAGRAFWKFAWGTPQAAAWDRGSHYLIARRASLEDDLVTLDGGVDLGELLSAVEDDEVAERISEAMATLKRLAGGRISVMKEIRELENKLGLNPEALAKLRWKIVAEPGSAEQQKPATSSRKSSSRRARLSVVA